MTRPWLATFEDRGLLHLPGCNATGHRAEGRVNPDTHRPATCPAAQRGPGHRRRSLSTGTVGPRRRRHWSAYCYPLLRFRNGKPGSELLAHGDSKKVGFPSPRLGFLEKLKMAGSEGDTSLTIGAPLKVQQTRLPSCSDVFRDLTCSTDML